MLKFLSKTLDVISVEQWIVELGSKFGLQLPLYQRVPEAKVRPPSLK